MKTLPSLLLLAAITAARAQTTATPQELHVRADLDGDNRPDLTIINRADGSFRTGYQMAPGILTWAGARASGAPGAAWATVGNLTGFPLALAVSAPESNLVSIFPAPSADSAVVPVLVYPSGIGPAGVIAADIGGPGNTPDDDLLLFTSLNDAPNSHRRELVRHTGGGPATFTPISQANGTAFRAGGGVRASDGGPLFTGLLEGPENAATFRLIDTTTGALVDKASAAGLPGTGFVSGRFTATIWHTAFFWQRNVATVAYRPAAQLGIDGVQFLAGGSFNAGRPVGEIILLSGGMAPRLLVVASDGTTAAVFDFNGTTATLAKEMSAPPGASFTGAFAGEGGGFTLLAGAPGTGLSTRFHPWNPDGPGYSPAPSGDLPGSRPPGTRANVFLFTSEPFVAANPGLTTSRNAPDWSSGVQFAGNPAAITANTEIYVNVSTGLGSPAPHPLGPAGGTAFALTNQIRRDISLSSYQTQLGPAGLEVKISPPAGSYAVAVEPKLTSTPAAASIFARTGNGAWTPAANFKPRLTTAATVQFYAQFPGSLRKTPVQSASYSFSVPDKLIDSDGDGVPDFVEGTFTPPNPPNPDIQANSGDDSDSDGYSDLEELLAGTEPMDPANKPSAHTSHGGTFTVRGALRPIDGTNNQRTTSAFDVAVSVFTPEGTSFAASSTVVTVPGYPIPAFNVPGLASLAPLAGVISQPVFNITTASSEKGRGREMAALINVPRLPVPKVNYLPGNGTVDQEKALWLAAAVAAQQASQPALVIIDPTEHHVLSALLFERWLNETAVARNLSGVTPDNVTVFPFRSGEASRRGLSPDEFTALRSRVSDALPGWNVAVVHEALRTAAVPPGTPALATLREVATRIYAVSSERAVGPDAPDYLPPLDVLRQFVRTGVLPLAYQPFVYDEATRTAAFQTIAPLLASLPSRPVATVDLQITAQTFSGPCPVLNRIGQAGQVSLIAAEGVPYVLPESFTLTPGARLRVTGYTDIADPDCPGDELEVLTLSVIHIPVPPSPDTDGDLLPDAWDCFFFAGGGEPLQDGDGDGFSNLQELLDGTDPMLPDSKGVVPVNLGPPQLKIELGGNLVIEWDYPIGYAGKMVFLIQCSEALGEWKTVEVIPVQNGGHFTVILPLPPDAKKFYRAVMKLGD